MDTNSSIRYSVSITYLLILFAIVGCGLGSSENNIAANNHPQGLVANSGSRIVELSWSGVPGATEYTIYWANSEKISINNASAIHTKEPYYQHHNLANGISYYYRISAHTSAGESAISEMVIGTPEAPHPAKPENATILAGDNRVTINFDLVAGATNYRIYWSTHANVTEESNRIDDIYPPFVHSDLTNGQTYYYLLVSENTQGKTSSALQLSTTPQKTLPKAPVITHAEAKSGQVLITWEDVSNAENFDLYWGTHPDITTEDAFIKQVNSPYTHTPLEELAGKQYYFRLLSHNSGGDSPLSNELSVTTPDLISIGSAGEKPTTPPLLANDGNAAITVDIEDRQLTLNWDISQYPDAQSYNIYWKKGTEDFDSALELGLNDHDGVIRNIKPPYTHISLNNKQYYYYRISAINHAGESTLTSLPVITGKPELITPGVPSGLSAIGADEQATISWNPVQRASSYTVTLSDSTISRDYENVISPFVITNLNNDISYKIRVRAINGEKPGERSEPVSVTPTNPVPHAPGSLLASPSNEQVTLQWKSAQPLHVEDTTEAVNDYRVYYRTRSGVTPNNGILLNHVKSERVADKDTWQATVPTLDNGQRYYFIVTALNNGGESLASPEVWALPQADIPNAPKNVFAEAGNNQITIHFTGIDSDVEPIYNLYWAKETAKGRTTTQVITNIKQTPAYVFTDGNSNGTRYFFQVSAAGTSGESILSAEVAATPQKPAPTSVIQNIRLKAANKHVTLHWDNVADASTYAIYWSTNPTVSDGNRIKVLSNDGDIGYDHTGLTNGETYYYRLSAINDGGQGPLSTVFVGQPQITAPATPTGLEVSAGDAQVIVNWSSSSEEPTTDDSPGIATGYKLYWNDDSNADINQWKSVHGVHSGYVLTGLSNGKTYYFKLVSQNRGGDSKATSTVTATPLKPKVLPPSAPTGATATAGDQQVLLSWDTQTDLHYNVYWTSESGDPSKIGTRVGDVLPSWIHGNNTPLTNGQTYRYQITANNPGGESTPSDIVSATPITYVASAPTTLIATAGTNSNALSWIAPQNAQDGIVYTLYWSLQAIDKNIFSNISKINNVSSPYTHTNLIDEKTYYYRITATNPDTPEGTSSNQATARTLLPKPATPLGLSVNGNDTRNFVSWLAVEKINSYTLEFSSNSSFTNSTSIPISASKTNYIHSGLTSGIEVFYRLRAENSSGFSDYSATASGTPIHINTNTAPVFGTAQNRTHSEGKTINNFSVTATDDDNDTLTYTATGYPAGVSFNNANATFSGTLAGDTGRSTPYVVTVTADDQSDEVNATSSVQFNWQINDVVTDASLSSATISPDTGVGVDQEITLVVYAKDNTGTPRAIGGDNVVITIQGVNENLTLPAVQDLSNGNYQLTYTPKTSGQDDYTITINGVNIGGGPYSKFIQGPVPVPSKTLMSVSPGPFTAGDTISLTANLFDISDNTTTAASVIFNITGANPQNITATYNTSNQTYEATLQANSAGSDTYTISIDSIEVPALSFMRTITAGTLDLTNTLLEVSPTTTSISTDETITITVKTRDAYGNIVYDSNNAISIVLPYANNELILPAITDNGNGSFTLNYQPEKAGTEYINLDVNSGAYTSSVYKNIIGGTAVPSSLQVNIPPGPLSVLHDYLLSADLFDQYGNPTSADVVFHVKGVNPQDLTTSYGYNSTTSSYNNRVTYLPSTLGNDTFTATVNGVDVAFNETRTIGPNRLPTADAGADYVVVKGKLVNISGELSTDPEGRNLSYTWLMTSQPSGSTASLNSNTNIRPTFTPDLLGSYTFSLTVKDNFDSSLNTDTVTVTAKDALKLDAPGTKAAPSSTAKSAVNDAGDMIAVWTMTNGVNQKTVASFKPVNGNWESDVELHQYTSQHEIVSSGSTFYFFYRRSSTVYLREFNGSTWSDETQFDPTYASSFDVQSNNGEMSYMAYNSQNIRSRKYEFNSTGGNWLWSDFQEVFTIPTNQTSLYHYIQNTQFLATNGTQSVVWNYRIYDTIAKINTYDLYASVNDNGTWSSPEAIVTNYNYQPNPRAVNSNNGMAVTWNDRRNIGTDVAPIYEYDFNARVFHAGAWTSIEAINTSTSSPQYSLISNTSGYAIAWIEYDPLNTTNPYIIYSTVFDYDSILDVWDWSNLMIIDANAQYTYAISLASNGINYVASWTDYDSNPAYSAFVSTYDTSTQTWQLPTALEYTNDSVSGSPTITSNGTDYAAVFRQYDPSISAYNIFTNMCDWSTSLNNCVWQTTPTPLKTDSINTGNPVLTSNGVGYLVHWLQTSTSSPNGQIVHFTDYDATNATWGTTKTLNAPTTAVTTENLGSISYLPNENYVFNWIHTSTDKVILYSSEFDGTNLTTAENLVKLDHEGSLIETQTNENINGDILVVTKQYNEGYYDLYGRLYSGGIWQSRFLISKRINTFKLQSIDSNFVIVYEEMADQYGSRFLNAVSVNKTTGLSTITQLSPTQNVTWKLARNDSNIAVVWGRSGLFGRIYNSGSANWDTETQLTSSTSNVRDFSLSTNGTGYGVSWASNISSLYDGFANIYKNGIWLGQQSIESGATNVGNRSYYGSPIIASDGNSYLVTWGQINADTNFYDIFLNQFDNTTDSWGTESIVHPSTSTGGLGLSLRGNTKGYLINWNYYDATAKNSVYGKDMRLINPDTGMFESVNPDSTGCNSAIFSTYEIYRTCNSYFLDYLSYSSSISTWEWSRQPGLYNVSLSSSSLAFNDKGDFAVAYRKWNSSAYNGFLAIHYASKGWDTWRVMGNNTNLEVVSNKVDPIRSGFSYHWRERNEIDATLINGWTMVDLTP